MKNGTGKQSMQLQELTSLLFATRRMVRQKLAARHGPSDPNTWLRMETLFFIREHRHSSMHAVAAHLHITVPSASSLVAKLVRGGLVKRIAGADKRVAQLSITPRGAHELARARRDAALSLHSVFGTLPPDELRTLIRILRRVADTGEKSGR